MVTLPKIRHFSPTRNFSSCKFCFFFMAFFSIACEEEEIRNVLNLRCHALYFRELRALEAHIVCLTIWHHLSLELWLVNTWFFAKTSPMCCNLSRKYRACNYKARQRMGIQLSHKKLNKIDATDAKVLANNGKAHKKDYLNRFRF